MKATEEEAKPETFEKSTQVSLAAETPRSGQASIVPPYAESNGQNNRLSSQVDAEFSGIAKKILGYVKIVSSLAGPNSLAPPAGPKMAPSPISEEYISDSVAGDGGLNLPVLVPNGKDGRPTTPVQNQHGGSTPIPWRSDGGGTSNTNGEMNNSNDGMNTSNGGMNTSNGAMNTSNGGINTSNGGNRTSKGGMSTTNDAMGNVNRDTNNVNGNTDSVSSGLNNVKSSPRSNNGGNTVNSNMHNGSNGANNTTGFSSSVSTDDRNNVNGGTNNTYGAPQHHENDGGASRTTTPRSTTQTPASFHHENRRFSMAEDVQQRLSVDISDDGELKVTAKNAQKADIEKSWVESGFFGSGMLGGGPNEQAPTSQPNQSSPVVSTKKGWDTVRGGKAAQVLRFLHTVGRQKCSHLNEK